MEKRKFYVEIATPGEPIYAIISAYVIAHALQVAEAFCLGKGLVFSIWEIRADPKRGANYEVEL